MDPHIEALRREMQSHIQNHDMRIDGVCRAVRLLTMTLIESGVLPKTDLQSRFDEWTDHVKSQNSEPSPREQMVMRLVESLLALEKEALRSPALRFQVIRGDLDE
jgi:hypothetical protein